MITDADVKKLSKVFVTKDDLKDLRSQLNDDIDGKLTNQKEEIVKDVAEYIVDTIVPMIDKQDKRVSRIEKKLNLSPRAD